MFANTWEIARNTLEDTIRKRVLVVFLVLAIVTLGLAVLIQYNAAANRAELYTPGQMIIVLIFGALIAITTAVFLIPTEIERRTIYSVLSKPVQRWEFFVGKFLGGSLTAGLMVAVMTAVLLVAIMIFAALPPADAGAAAQSGQGAVQIPWLKAVIHQAVPIIIGGLLVFFQMIAITAIATFLSLFLTATVNFSVTAFLWILGSLQWILLALANRQDQGLVLVPWLLKGAYYLTPHFYDINVMGGLVKPEVAIKTTPLIYIGTVSLYGVLYIAVMLYAGILAFSKKEV